MKKPLLILFLSVILNSFQNLSLTCSSLYAETITKTVYEEFFRYHDFSGWLGSNETISSCDIKIYEKITNTDKSSTMLSDVSPYQTKCKYKLLNGDEGKFYYIKIKTATSNGQKFEDWLDLAVK
jgi:hypothetical protein